MYVLKLEVFVCYSFNIEANSRRRSDHLVWAVKLVENGRLIGTDGKVKSVDVDNKHNKMGVLESDVLDIKQPRSLCILSLH
jgi:hypothetical protein